MPNQDYSLLCVLEPQSHIKWTYNAHNVTSVFFSFPDFSYLLQMDHHHTFTHRELNDVTEIFGYILPTFIFKWNYNKSINGIFVVTQNKIACILLYSVLFANFYIRFCFRIDSFSMCIFFSIMEISIQIYQTGNARHHRLFHEFMQNIQFAFHFAKHLFHHLVAIFVLYFHLRCCFSL